MIERTFRPGGKTRNRGTPLNKLTHLRAAVCSPSTRTRRRRTMMLRPSGCGGIGRRAGFRYQWPQGRVGSTPIIRIPRNRPTASPSLSNREAQGPILAWRQFRQFARREREVLDLLVSGLSVNEIVSYGPLPRGRGSDRRAEPALRSRPVPIARSPDRQIGNQVSPFGCRPGLPGSLLSPYLKSICSGWERKPVICGYSSGLSSGWTAKTSTRTISS